MDEHPNLAKFIKNVVKGSAQFGTKLAYIEMDTDHYNKLLDQLESGTNELEIDGTKISGTKFSKTEKNMLRLFYYDQQGVLETYQIKMFLGKNDTRIAESIRNRR